MTPRPHPPTPRDPSPAAARWLLAESRVALLWHRLMARVCLRYALAALADGRLAAARLDFRRAASHAADAVRCAVTIPLLKRAAGPNVRPSPGGVTSTLAPDDSLGGATDGHGQA